MGMMQRLILSVEARPSVVPAGRISKKSAATSNLEAAGVLGLGAPVPQIWAVTMYEILCGRA